MNLISEAKKMGTKNTTILRLFPISNQIKKVGAASSKL
jgi:hypothetical protein